MNTTSRVCCGTILYQSVPSTILMIFTMSPFFNTLTLEVSSVQTVKKGQQKLAFFDIIKSEVRTC